MYITYEMTDEERARTGASPREEWLRVQQLMDTDESTLCKQNWNKCDDEEHVECQYMQSEWTDTVMNMWMPTIVVIVSTFEAPPTVTSTITIEDEFKDDTTLKLSTAQQLLRSLSSTSNCHLDYCDMRIRALLERAVEKEEMSVSLDWLWDLERDVKQEKTRYPDGGEDTTSKILRLAKKCFDLPLWHQIDCLQTRPPRGFWFDGCLAFVSKPDLISLGFLLRYGPVALITDDNEIPGVLELFDCEFGDNIAPFNMKKVYKDHCYYTPSSFKNIKIVKTPEEGAEYLAYATGWSEPYSSGERLLRL